MKLIGSGTWPNPLHRQRRRFHSVAASSVAPVQASALCQQNTQSLNIEINFEEALKLNLSISERVRKLNSYNRSTTAGKGSGLNVAVHLGRGVITHQRSKTAKNENGRGRIRDRQETGRAGGG